ncbi:MAG: hypothetical protein M1496_02820 [Candidatus Thermoplasmatota archaeon]|jgi:vacuolar-type H+-ATPase subunit E/Vma4|nr:hypothetical protein [Candidatus Thermoplasmatota archaeon]
MSSEDIIANIEKKGKEDLARMTAECESRITQIKSEKKAKLDEIEKRWEKKIHEDVKNLEKRGEDESLLEYRNIIMNKKSSEVSSFVENSENFYENIRELKGYETFIGESVTKALDELGKNCTIVVSQKDRKIISKIEGNFETKETKEPQIGILALSKDGMKTLDMTLRSMLLENRQELEEMLVSLMGAN